KMKDRAGKWRDEKNTTRAKGRTAYRKFMGEGLKKAPPQTGEGNRGPSRQRRAAPPSSLAPAAPIFQNNQGRRERPGLRVRRQMLCRGEVGRSSVSSSSLSPSGDT